MKLKGINPFEQHVEKLVLGVVGVVFLGVLAMQFLVSPNEVNYEGQMIAPDSVLERLGGRADELLGKMTDPSPVLPEVETPDLASRFDAAFGKPAIGEDRIAAVPFGSGFGLEIAEVEDLDGPVTALALPAPPAVQVASQWTTADPFFLRAHPEVRAHMFRERQPFDEVSVTVETVLDGTAIESALREAAEGRRAIPSHWWSEGGQGLVEVLGVEVERQRRQADGSWGAAEPVESVRWTPTAMEALNEGASEDDVVGWEGLGAADLRELARLAQDDPSLVSQPPYVPSISGVEWVPPSKVDEREARLEMDARIARAEDRLGELEDELAKMKDRQAGRSNDPGSRDPAGGGRRSGGSSGLIIGGGGSRSGGSRSQRDDPMDVRIERKEEEIAEQEDSIAALEEEYEELAKADPSATARSPRRSSRPAANPGRPSSGPIILGGDPTGGRTATGTRSSRRGSRQSAIESPGPLLEVEEYQVWTHDLTAEPGAEYRYRLRYGVNNPLYGRERSLGSDDEALMAEAKKPVVQSPWSEWSESMQVADDMYYFVTSARDRGQLGQGAASATAEVYQMFYGYYRGRTMTLEPGMAVQGQFELPEDLPRFEDMRNITEADLMAYFDEREAEDDPRARPVADPDAEPVERPWLSMVEPQLRLPLNMVLLDVADYPIASESGSGGSAGRREFEVFFFDPNVGVVSRRPTQDRGQGAYAVVERLSRLAESAEIRRPDPAYLP